MIKISCVSYLNSRPFIFGLQHADIKNEIELSLDSPAECAKKLELGITDIGLVPVAILDESDDFHVISDYCIGADGNVDSVLLLSQVPLHDIKTILLDYQSRTSIMLAQVLAHKFWNIHPQWVDAAENFETMIEGDTAGIVIGDRTFELKKKFKYVYDLAGEWKKFTRLPFVFACWVSNKELDRNFVKRFNQALRSGLINSEEVIEQYKKENHSKLDVQDYLQNKVSYSFDESKKFSLQLFLSYMHELMGEDAMKIV
jgi:chorismate dehydratase